MPHSLSAKKRERQNIKRRALNRSRRSALRSKLRKCADLFLHGSVDEAADSVRVATKWLDREAARGVIHRNAAARQKSRLAKRLDTMRAKAASAS